MARMEPRLVSFAILIAVVAADGSRLHSANRSDQAELAAVNGKKLFEKETFGGNGRTCRSCHGKFTGTVGLEDVQRMIDKGDPESFLVGDALDDDGVGTTRVQANATIRMTIKLPPWVTMAD